MLFSLFYLCLSESVCTEMAEAGFSKDQFSCPLCLDLLKGLVTIPCGHSYCMSCITDHWNQEDTKRVYSCPQCRKTFRPRPALNKSTMLAEVLEKPKLIIQTTVPAEQHENLLKVNIHNLMNTTGRPLSTAAGRTEKQVQTQRH